MLMPIVSKWNVLFVLWGPMGRILQLQWGYSYSERLFILNLESLELRRLYSDLKIYFWIIHKLIDSVSSDFFLLWPQGVLQLVAII